MARRLALILALSLPLLAFLSPQHSAGAAMPVRWGYYTGYDKATSLPSLRAHVQDLTHVSPWYGFQFDAAGRLAGSDDPEVTGLVRSAGRRILPLVQNTARYDEFHRLIASPSMRTQMARAIAALVRTKGYHGINVDFEGVNATDRPHMTAFMAELYPLLRADGRTVTMAVPAKRYDATTGWAGAYDYAALARHADLFIIMAYDYHSSGSKPGPIAPLDWVREVTAYANATLGASKVVVSLALYGYDWNVSTGAKATATKFPQIATLRSEYGATLGYDAATQSAWAKYTASGQRHEVWYENGRTLDAKLAVARRAGARGVAVWRLGQEDPRVWTSIRGLSVGASPAAFSPNADGYADRASVSYRLEQAATVTVEVLDAAGRVVRTLQRPASQTGGGRSVSWDGATNAGSRAPDGRYAARVTATIGGSPVSDSVPLVVNTALRRLTLSTLLYAPASGRLTGAYAVAAPARVSVIVRQGTRTVRTLQAAVSRPTGAYTFAWDGRLADGSPAPAGGYSVVVAGDSAAGRSALVRDLALDRIAPAITNARLSGSPFFVNGATAQTWTHHLSEDASVELRLTRSGRVVRTLTASQRAGANTLRWTGYLGAALAEPGTYGYTISATDAAGNRSSAVSGSFAVAR
jgi:spore germination protein YaaH/flagellar hook assembly protein FlgD